tara:strand:+ start:98 stop:262 length:165 start_codon:yes stop_codon:yes gene_type:complete
MKIFYYFTISLVYHSIIHSQGLGFPDEPVQGAPIGGLWLLIAGGTALAYKRFKK